MIQTQPSRLIPPYGNRLTNLVIPAPLHEERKALAETLPSTQLTERAVCDLEVLATGGFSPLDRFMRLADYQ